MAASSNNAVIGALRIEATLDAGKFVTGAARIRKESKQTEATVKSSFTGMGAAMKAGIAGFAGVLSVGYFTSLIQASLRYAGSLAETAQQLGVTARQLQVYRFAAGQVGVSQEQLEVGLKKLNTSLGQAKLGAEAPKKAFAELSKLIGQDIVKSSQQGGDALPLVADALAKVGDRSKRAAVEVALMGKSGSALDNLLAGGSAALDRLSAAAEKLGIVLSDEQIQRADDTADKLEALKTVLSAQIAGVVSDNAKAIYELADSIIHLVAQIPNAIRSLRSFYASFLDFTATVTEKVDQAIESPINMFNPLAAPFRGGAMHANRLANIQADRKAAADVRKDILAGQVHALPILPPELQHGRLPKGADIGQFLAPGGGSKKKGPEDQSAETIAQFQRDQLQADAEILRAKQQLATSATERAKIELQLIELDRQQQDAEIDDRVRRAQKDAADGRITKGALREVEVQAAILKSKNDQVAQLKAQAVLDERTRQEEQDAFDATVQSKQFAIDSLHFADQMAETQADHRRIQLEILDAELEQKRLELEHEKQLAIRNGATQQEIDAIQARIDHLPIERAQGAAGVVAGTRSPMEDYIASLPTTAEKLNEAFQRLEVQGFEGLIDAALQLEHGFKSAIHALLDTVEQFFLGLARLQLQRGLGSLLQSTNFTGSLGNLFGGGGFSSSSFASTVASNNAALGVNLPGFATGGSFIFKGMPGTDNNILSLNGMPIARVSYGEAATFGNDNSPRSAQPYGRGGVVMNFYTPDADSFRRSGRQVARQAKRTLAALD